VKQLEAHEYPVAKIFSNDYEFHIPDYQRPYAWESEQVIQLLEDLVDALDRGGDEPYFLGSMVLVKDAGVPVADVIDGQQRLTTLTILLAVLRDLTQDASVAATLDVMIREPGNPVLQLSPRPRLTLRPRDADFFTGWIQEPGRTAELARGRVTEGETDPQKAVRANTRILLDRLETWDESRRLDLLRMLGQRTYLVVVSTPDLDSAHRIFSVMNSRGLDLSPADIFKARVIGDMDEDQAKTYAGLWEAAEEDLGRQDFADLFNHVRMVYAKERARRELLREFPEQVLDKHFTGEGARFVDEVVVPYAEAYQRMRDFAYSAPEGSAEVNAWFRRLALINNADWKPPALWALRHHGDDPRWLDDFLRALERLAASMLVRRVYATPRGMRYAELLQQLDDGMGLEAPALALDRTERSDTRSRLDGDIYSVTALRKFVLLRLDEALARASGVQYQHSIITVEHVLPQSPRAGSRWLKDFDEDQRRLWTHRLANLVLLNRQKNSEARNFDFDRKKAGYFAGKRGVAAFALTSQVLAQSEWTPKVLERRQLQLLNTLTAEWHLA
jgi:hypothetical protein